MAPITILETRALTKSYGGINANLNIDFTLNQGQTMALIGPNGAGKSTFIGMICGRIPATSGHVYFKGQNISSLPTYQRISLGIAYTFQITSVFQNLPVRENIALAVRRVKMEDKNDIQKKVEEVATRVGLQSRIDQLAGDLSYGHQRILEIAMGLAQNPELFILDEPTQGLADAEVNEFIELVKELAGFTTILLIEHNMDVVMRTAELVTVLNFGEILATGSIDEIRNNEDVQLAYLGKSDA